MKQSKFINIKCLSVHIGSQILNHKPYEKMLNVLDKLLKNLDYKFEIIDLGGGMGINYDNKTKKLNYTKYKKSIIKFKNKYNCKIIFEPGRSIIGNVGILASKVIYLKHNKTKTFVILDAAMNDLIRPALYNAKHEIIPVIKSKKRINGNVEFVGPICESSDTFLKYKNFTSVNEGSLVAITNVGAYGSTLSSNYNTRPLAAEIIIKKGQVKVIRKRQKISEII